jgi:hypothetical protein
MSVAVHVEGVGGVDCGVDLVEERLAWSSNSSDLRSASRPGRWV